MIRTLLARLPLPMLALAASYGVYQYALLFVPWQVAVIQAAAFELTYIGLAVAVVDPAQRRRATWVSRGAVITSILYNSLAGWFHRMPELLTGANWAAWLALAILHGAPLAWVAYLVSTLLLHSEQPVSIPPPPPTQLTVNVAQVMSLSEQPLDMARQLRAEGVPWRQVAERVGMPESTLRRQLQHIKETV